MYPIQLFDSIECAIVIYIIIQTVFVSRTFNIIKTFFEFSFKQKCHELLNRVLVRGVGLVAFK